MLLRAGGAVFFHGARLLHTVAPIAELRETSNRCINVDPLQERTNLLVGVRTYKGSFSGSGQAVRWSDRPLCCCVRTFTRRPLLRVGRPDGRTGLFSPLRSQG